MQRLRRRWLLLTSRNYRIEHETRKALSSPFWDGYFLGLRDEALPLYRPACRDCPHFSGTPGPVCDDCPGGPYPEKAVK